MNKSKLLLLSVFFSLTLYAQPHIKGRIEIDRTLGIIKCTFTLSKIPEIEGYSILLNKGMNITYIKDAKGQLIDYNGYYNGTMKGEAIAYTLGSSASSPKKLPSTFFIDYVGAFPVYKKEYNSFDFKGNIAINEKTLRAAEQTKWYPVLYDTKNDKVIHSYTYDLLIKTKESSTVFINGSAPKKGTEIQLSSTKAHPLLLFMGDYNYIGYQGDYILNSDISEETSKFIFKNIEEIKNYYATRLEMAFTDHIYIINHESVNKRKKGSSWGFNTYPAFAFTGLNFKDLVSESNRFSEGTLKFFGHEFGHNYFGNNVMSGPLSWFWSESFAEYLSFGVALDLGSNSFLKDVLLYHANVVKEGTFTPLSKIKTKKEIGEKYRYSLGALLLQCFEDTFGKKHMNTIIKALLKTSASETLRLNSFKRAALNSGIDKRAYEKFHKMYIANKNFKEHIVKRIEEDYGSK